MRLGEKSGEVVLAESAEIFAVAHLDVEGVKLHFVVIFAGAYGTKRMSGPR